MTSIPDHYAALGIDPTADPEVITAAYRALAKKFHPDTGAAAGTASPERFDAIQKAYEVLRTPESRHAYDLELLAATEAELEAHLASKRRVAVRERAARAEQAEAGPPPPDLGEIRPEPVTKPAGRAAAPPARGRQKPRRSLFPFAIPVLLMMAIGGGLAWALMPRPPAGLPLPGSQQVARSEAPATTPVITPGAGNTQAKAAEAAPQSPPAAPSAAADADVPDGPPVFGSSVTDSADAPVEEAAATPEPVPATDAGGAPSGAAEGKADRPVFGSSGELQVPASPAAAPADAVPPAAAAPAPLPKPRPSQPTRQALQQPKAQSAQPKVAAVQPRVQPAQPRVRLQYQDPPQYDPQGGYYGAEDGPPGYPQPDDYPPPGYAPPGYEPPGYAPPGYAPGGFGNLPGEGPYRLVIFERQPGQQATAWSAGVVFNSMGKCTRVGVKTVLRRTAALDPYAGSTRVWYECQQLSQR